MDESGKGLKYYCIEKQIEPFLWELRIVVSSMNESTVTIQIYLSLPICQPNCFCLVCWRFSERACFCLVCWWFSERDCFCLVCWWFSERDCFCLVCWRFSERDCFCLVCWWFSVFAMNDTCIELTVL